MSHHHESVDGEPDQHHDDPRADHPPAAEHSAKDQAGDLELLREALAEAERLAPDHMLIIVRHLASHLAGLADKLDYAIHRSLSSPNTELAPAEALDHHAGRLRTAIETAYQRLHALGANLPGEPQPELGTPSSAQSAGVSATSAWVCSDSNLGARARLFAVLGELIAKQAISQETEADILTAVALFFEQHTPRGNVVSTQAATALPADRLTRAVAQWQEMAGRGLLREMILTDQVRDLAAAIHAQPKPAAGATPSAN